MRNFPKITGRLRTFKNDKRFGFIARDDGEPDVFVSNAAFDLGGIDYVEVGMRLAFVIEQGKSGLRGLVGATGRAAMTDQTTAGDQLSALRHWPTFARCKLSTYGVELFVRAHAGHVSKAVRHA